MDRESRAHDLAIAFVQSLYSDAAQEMNRSSLDDTLESYAADYEIALRYFIDHLEP